VTLYLFIYSLLPVSVFLYVSNPGMHPTAQLLGTPRTVSPGRT